MTARYGRFDVSAEEFAHSWFREASAQGTLDEGVARLAGSSPMTATIFGGLQSNTSVVVEIGGPSPRRLIIKSFDPVPGVHPELEISRALAEAKWPHTPPLVGWTTDGDCLKTLATEWVADSEDGFVLMSRLAGDGRDPVESARSLGSVTAQLHDILRDRLPTADSIAPDGLAARIRERLARTTALGFLDEALPARLAMRIDDLGALTGLPRRQRIHGDYHLGQTLHADRWYVLDFEGEPLRPLDERREPDLALRDVAGMLRSFGYAANRGDGPVDEAAGDWERTARRSFLEGYGLEPDGPETILLDALEIEKALYEVEYEAARRPDWVRIPVAALRRLAGADS